MTAKAQRYQKKPVTIEAIQLTGTKASQQEILDWVNFQAATFAYPSAGCDIKLYTLNGEMLVHEGDWVIKNMFGRFHFCPASIFEETYEQA